jgi:hypothetical protein
VRNEANSGRSFRCEEESVGQAPPYKRAQLRQTNPIRPGRTGRPGIRRDEMCRTNPIAGGRRLGPQEESTRKRSGGDAQSTKKRAEQSQRAVAGSRLED